MIFLIIWNVVLTIAVIFIALRLTIWKKEWPIIRIRKDGFWIGKAHNGGCTLTGIITWGKSWR